MTSITSRLRNLSQYTYSKEHRDIMIDAARLIETLEAAQPQDAKCPGDIYDDMVATCKERYYLEEGPHWKIYDREGKAPHNGPMCVAYCYTESFAHEVLGNLNNPARGLGNSVPHSVHHKQLAEAARANSAHYKRQLDEIMQAATSRCLGVYLAEHVKHLEELAVDRLRLLDDQTAKLYIGLSAEQWYAKFAEQVSRCSAAEYAARATSNVQYYEGHSAEDWHKQYEMRCSLVRSLNTKLAAVRTVLDT